MKKEEHSKKYFYGDEGSRLIAQVLEGARVYLSDRKVSKEEHLEYLKFLLHVSDFFNDLRKKTETLNYADILIHFKNIDQLRLHGRELREMSEVFQNLKYNYSVIRQYFEAIFNGVEFLVLTIKVKKLIR